MADLRRIRQDQNMAMNSYLDDILRRHENPKNGENPGGSVADAERDLDGPDADRQADAVRSGGGGACTDPQPSFGAEVDHADAAGRGGSGTCTNSHPSFGAEANRDKVEIVNVRPNSSRSTFGAEASDEVEIVSGRPNYSSRSRLPTGKRVCVREIDTHQWQVVVGPHPRETPRNSSSKRKNDGKNTGTGLSGLSGSLVSGSDNPNHGSEEDAKPNEQTLRLLPSGIGSDPKDKESRTPHFDPMDQFAAPYGVVVCQSPPCDTTLGVCRFRFLSTPSKKSGKSRHVPITCKSRSAETNLSDSTISGATCVYENSVAKLDEDAFRKVNNHFYEGLMDENLVRDKHAKRAKSVSDLIAPKDRRAERDFEQLAAKMRKCMTYFVENFHKFHFAGGLANPNETSFRNRYHVPNAPGTTRLMNRTYPIIDTVLHTLQEETKTVTHRHGSEPASNPAFAPKSGHWVECDLSRLRAQAPPQVFMIGQEKTDTTDYFSQAGCPRGERPPPPGTAFGPRTHYPTAFRDLESKHLRSWSNPHQLAFGFSSSDHGPYGILAQEIGVPPWVMKYTFRCKEMKKDVGQLSPHSQTNQASGDKNRSTNGCQNHATYFCYPNAREQSAPRAPSAPKNHVD